MPDGGNTPGGRFPDTDANDLERILPWLSKLARGGPGSSAVINARAVRRYADGRFGVEGCAYAQDLLTAGRLLLNAAAMARRRPARPPQPARRAPVARGGG